MNLVSNKGLAVAADTVCLAEYKNSDGSLTIFFKTDEDIAALIQRYKDDGCEDQDLLEPEFWLTGCERLAGGHCNQGRDCPAGKRCVPVSMGHGTFCRCQ